MFIPVLNDSDDQYLAQLEELKFLGPVYIEMAASALSLESREGISPFETLLRDKSVFIGPFSSRNSDQIGTWLDKGAEKVVLEASLIDVQEVNKLMTAASQFPSSRTLLSFTYDSRENDAEYMMQIMQNVKETISGVIVRVNNVKNELQSTERTSFMTSVLPALCKVFQDVYIQCSSENLLTAEQVGFLHKEKNVHVAGPAKVFDLTEDAPVDSKFMDVADAFIACLRTDRPDGLYTTVVTDECGVALGLVYSSKESIKASLACARGVYYSRSRGGLWRKGDTSGAYQELKSISVDCDSDALRFKVNQLGTPAAFCHLNTRTCWGESGGLTELERTLVSRKSEAPEGSYTKRLFDDSTLLRNKLLEEAQELAEAEDKEDVAGEAADLIYFALVRCVAAGVKIADVERYLDWRSRKVKRRPGNSKAFRIEAAKEALEKLGKK